MTKKSRKIFDEIFDDICNSMISGIPDNVSYEPVVPAIKFGMKID